MTAAFDAFIAAGSGHLDFELRLEGLSRIFVSNEDHAAIADASGRTRVPGLRRDGIGFSERVYLAGAELDLTIGGINVDEEPGAWLGIATAVFTTTATRVGTLTATLAAADVTASVLDSSVFTDGYYYIGTETVQVTARPSGVTITVVRARYESTAMDHPVSSGESAIATDIYDAPTGLMGRRVWLYARTLAEAAVADTTVVWRGFLSREPTLAEDDALSWSLAVEPRTKALDASLAGGFDKPFALRGAYYPGIAPFSAIVLRGSTSSGGAIAARAGPITLSGFFVDNDAFASAYVALLNADATIASWGITFSYAVIGGAWELYVTTASADARMIDVGGGSDTDGYFDGYLYDDTTYSDPIFVPVVSTSTTYRLGRNSTWGPGVVPFPEQRRIPRMSTAGFGTAGTGLGTGTVAADIASFPAGRIYLDRLGALSTSDDITIEPMFMRHSGGRALPIPEGWEPDGIMTFAPQRVFRITAIDSANGYVTVDAARPPFISASGAVQPSIGGAARYASGAGDLEDLRVDILARAPVVANRGQGPWLTSDDVASWDAVVTEAAAGRPWLASRLYSWSKPAKAIDVFREEWKIYGVFPHLNADARLVVDLLTVDTAASASVAITADDVFADESLGSVSPDADGLVTVVHVLRGYDPAEDKHVERDFIYRGMAAIARVHAERVLEIAPMSRAVGEEPAWEDLYDRAAAIIAFFGTRRCVSVKFAVSIRQFAVLVGAWIDLTIAALPLDGARGEWTSGGGIASRRCLVIGREWDLSSGAGSFEVLVPDMAENIAGYAPSSRVTGASGAGTTWTLTVTQTHYAATGNDSAQFVVGQAIRLIEFDAAAPTIREGTVTSIAATTIGVELATAWGGMGGATYYTLSFDTSDDAQTTATQLTRCFLAASTGRIPLLSGTSAARDFAP